MLALALLVPLAACAAQPAAPPRHAGRRPAQRHRQPAAPARRHASRAGAAPAAPRAAAARLPPAQAAPRHTRQHPAAERATTVGEVPATHGHARSRARRRQHAAAPAAIPGTPASPARMLQPASGPRPVAAANHPRAGPGAGAAGRAGLGHEALRPEDERQLGQPALVGALNIGGRERIMVVEVGDQWIVVGASPGRVNALATHAARAKPRSAAAHAGRPHAVGRDLRRLAETDDRQAQCEISEST